MGESIAAHIPSKHNPDDIATIVVPVEAQQDYLVGLVIYDLTD